MSSEFEAHRKDLVAHVSTEKHKIAVETDKCAKSCQKLTSTLTPICPEKTKIAELKLAAFIAEHTFLQTVNHLAEILPKLGNDSDT